MQASFQQVTADFYGISESSVCNILPVVSEKIAHLRQNFIKMPTSDEGIEQKKESFFFLVDCLQLLVQSMAR